MNNIINKFLLAGDKFMPEMHLRQPRFVYSGCGPFTRHKERIKEFKRTGDTLYIYRNELDKACFQHDSAYADHKDLINRTEADKVLKDKAYDIASNPEYDGYQKSLASMVYKFFDKKSTGSGFKKLKNTTKPSSSILADELHKPAIRKFKKGKVYSQLKDNIWGVDLAGMQSLSRKNKGIKYFLCAIDLYSKYAFVIPLENKKGVMLRNVLKNDVVKKTDYSTKVTSIEAQIAGLTKSTVDNLSDITELKAIDTNSFVLKTKFSADINTLDDKIDGVEKKNLI